MIQFHSLFVVFMKCLDAGFAMNIDMRTVVFVSVLINTICSLFVVKLWHQNRNRYDGLGYLVMYFVFFTVALGLIFLRNYIPDLFSIIISNTLIFFGLFFCLTGFAKFSGVKLSLKVKVFNCIYILIAFGVHVFFTYWYRTLPIRIYNISIYMIVLSFQVVWLLAYKADPGIKAITKLIKFVFMLMVVLSLIRMMDAFYSVSVTETYFHAGLFQTFIYLIYQMIYVTFTYSVVLMVNQRLVGEIKAQEKKFFAAFNSSPYAIILTRLEDGLIFDVNQGFQDIMGFEKEEVLGKSTIELDVWDNNKDREVFLKKISETGHIGGLDLKFRNKVGEKLIGHVLADIIDIDGERCLLASVEDVTEKRKMGKIMQQTAKLDSLGVLAGGIAHDFNNLLGGIFGYIDIAQTKSKDPGISSYLTKALNTIERAKRLTLQLLTFSKGGAPRKETRKLFPFVQETVEFALSGSNVACDFDHPEDLWMCDYDKEQMAQVIDNLVINAKQAMSKGGRLSVKAENVSIEEQHPNLEEGNYVKIDFADTGKGIPEELIYLIFDPFFTTKTKGHGLGLATSYSIVTRHNGTIDVSSEEGKGATFTVFLPADIDAEKEVTEITTSKYVGDGTVLIMDDEDVIREILTEMLQVIGFDVIPAATGEEAVKKFKEAAEEGKMISCFIFDLTVPGGMGGREAVTMIREINPSVPVFVASGYADDPAISEPQKFGFRDSIAKPFTMDKISEMLKKNL